MSGPATRAPGQDATLLEVVDLEKHFPVARGRETPSAVHQNANAEPGGLCIGDTGHDTLTGTGGLVSVRVDADVGIVRPGGARRFQGRRGQGVAVLLDAAPDHGRREDPVKRIGPPHESEAHTRGRPIAYEFPSLHRPTPLILALHIALPCPGPP